jgi:p-aminobenzoyl-glutamate transporter AbgT
MSILNKTTSELTVKDTLIMNGFVLAIMAVPIIGSMVYGQIVASREAKKNADNTAYKKK